MIANEKITEWCSNCQHEVELKDAFEKQICPECNESILPCSICETVGKCGDCPIATNRKMIMLQDYEGEFEVEHEWLKFALERLEWGTVKEFLDNHIYDDAQTIRDNYLEDIARLHLDCGSCGSEAVEKVGYGFKEGQGLFIRIICSTCGESSDCGDGDYFTEKH